MYIARYKVLSILLIDEQHQRDTATSTDHMKGAGNTV